MSLKFKYNNETRRVPCDGSSFALLEKTLSQALKLEDGCEVKITYEDEDGDVIRIKTDVELRTFLAEREEKAKWIKVTTSVVTPPSSNTTTTTTKVRPPSPTSTPVNEAKTSIKNKARLIARFCGDGDSDLLKVKQGAKFNKTWKFRNETEAQEWPDIVYMMMVGGKKMGREKMQVDKKHHPRPREEARITIEHLVAPEKRGESVSYWRLCDERSKKFGQRVRLKVYVFSESDSDNDDVGGATVIEDKEKMQRKEELKQNCIKSLEAIGFEYAKVQHLLDLHKYDLPEVVKELQK